MRTIMLYFITIIVVTMFYSCRYCDEERSPDIAAVWKNGVRQKLTDVNYSTRANSIYVAGNDVYVAGNEGYEDLSMLWINGVAQTLQGGKNATSVFVSGEDVYVVGFVRSSSFVPMLWKNGIEHHFTDDSGLYYPAVYVYENNVYVAWRNKVWENEEIKYILTGTVNSIYVFGGDIYVAGTEKGKATLWKNGVAQTLPGGSNANSVFVSNNDVYVVGGNKLWKNGIEQILTGASGSATSVFVSGNDVYVTTEYSVLKNGRVIQNATTSEYFPSFTEYYSSIFVSNNDVYVAGDYNISMRVCD